MKKRTTLYVDAELLSEFKQKCKKDGTTMSRKYEQFIRSYVSDINSHEDRMTVTDSMSVNLNKRGAKSWIKQKLGL